MKLDSRVENQQPDPKRKKTDHTPVDKTTKETGKMIELDYVSSDDDIDLIFTR